MKLRMLMVGIAFVAGILASNMLTQAAFSAPYGESFEMPANNGFLAQEPNMPQDRIKEKQIIVQKDRVVLDIQNAQWSSFTPTKSMVPFIDTGANAIQIAPKEDCESIEIGDVISYEPGYVEGIIIHRVIDEGVDKEGKYFRAKGDNNPNADPGKVRCGQIKRVLVAVVY